MDRMDIYRMDRSALNGTLRVLNLYDETTLPTFLVQEIARDVIINDLPLSQIEARARSPQAIEDFGNAKDLIRTLANGAKSLGGLRFLRPLELRHLAKLQLELVGGTNAPWQRVKFVSHLRVTEVGKDSPKRGAQSGQKFFKKYFGLKETDPKFKALVNILLEGGHLKGDISLRLNHNAVRGDHPEANKIFVDAYVNHAYPPEGVAEFHYPGVDGSCMRHDRWEVHPIQALATPDIGLVWLTNEEGLTVARTLVNLKTNTLVRAYTGSITNEQNYAQELELQKVAQEFLGTETLPEYSDEGLVGCEVHISFKRVNGTDMVILPYIDGDHDIVSWFPGDAWGAVMDGEVWDSHLTANPKLHWAQCCRTIHGAQRVVTPPENRPGFEPVTPPLVDTDNILLVIE